MKTTNAAATLASVVFLKIQEFARRSVPEQARLRAQLEAVVAVTAAELAPADRIVLDASDGIAVVVLGDPKGALRLGERALSAAASVAEFATPSRLLISRTFRDALADVTPGFESGLFPAGVFTDAGLRTHELFSPDKVAAERRRRRLLALGFAALACFVGAGVAVRVSTGGRAKLFDDMLGKFGVSAKERDAYLRGLREKFKF